MAGSDESTIGGSIEVSLCPIPCCVAADCPPGGSSDPAADAEDKSDEGGCEDADPVFPAVPRMHGAEQRRRQPGGLPEPRTWSLIDVQQQAGSQTEHRDDVDAPRSVAFHAPQKQAADHADYSHSPPEIDAAGERVQQIAAHRAFFKAAHHQEYSATDQRVFHNVRSTERDV